MTVDAALWALFVGLLGAGLWIARPRPPRWSPVLFHHAVLATLLRGRVEAAGGTIEDWEALLRSRLPAGPTPPPGGWTEDPDALGPDYDPVARLGADATWEALAAGHPAVAEAVHRRFDDVRLVWFGEPALVIPGVPRHVLAEPQLADLALPDQKPSTRLVLATRDHGARLVAALRDAPGLRDRVRALLFVDATFDPAVPVSQDAFDTEVDRTTPWFVLRTRAGADAELADPPLPDSQRRSLQVHDLGTVSAEALADPALGQSVAILLAAGG